VHVSSGELCVSENLAASEALMPAFLGGFNKHVQSLPAGPEGLDGLLWQLERAIVKWCLPVVRRRAL
jgi:hypothetical protein